MLLGCVADDLTGATDLASVLARQGWRVDVVVGVPEGPVDADAVDAVVVALKSRSVPPADAVAWSTEAGRRLLAAGAEQLYFKYCSTFDSTAEGNIGPVAGALLDLVGDTQTVFCPAYPAQGRTVYASRLFVDGVPLDETGMRHHPRTPMTDANLVRVLSVQSSQEVGAVTFATVDAGAAAVRSALAEAPPFVVVDAVTERHLDAIAEACADRRLLTGGAGLAGATARRAQVAARRAQVSAQSPPGPPPGRTVILAGSCSPTTRAQLDRFAEHYPTVRLDPYALADGFDPVPVVLALQAASDDPVLVASTAGPDQVAAVQAALGAERANHLIESTLGRIAAATVAAGMRRVVVAGGETAGAVAQALGLRRLRVGRELDVGVPWMTSDEPRLAVVLKSGNFGNDDLFLQGVRDA